MSQPAPITFNQIPTLDLLLSAYPGVNTLFFDMDGTLFDTEPYHTQAFLKIGKDHQIIPPHPLEIIHEMLVGKADHLVYEVVKSWKGFPEHWKVEDFVLEKSQNLMTILQQLMPDSFFNPKLRKLLLEARTRKMYLGLVTSSEKDITTYLLHLAGLEGFFDLVLTRDDCPRHKPDPWPYFKAIESAGVSAHEVLVFEDSGVGIEAAHASGAHVIKVKWH